MSRYIDVKAIELSGLHSALKALRLPYGKDCRSMSEWEGTLTADLTNPYDTTIYEYGGKVRFCDKDILLMSTLAKRGDEHAKVLRGIIVYAEINAPRYFWQEMDTYKIGAERLSSESTMHIQGRGLNTDELVKMKEELKEGTMQRRVQYFSYQTLRRIYYQRKDHRLPHWHEFCAWIENLPLAKELILVK